MQFQLKFVTSSSGKFIEIKYRQGLFWHYIYGTRPPWLPDDWYGWEPFWTPLSIHSSYSDLQKKFSSLEKIKEFEREQRKEMEEGNAKLKKERNEYWGKVTELLNNLNQTN